MLHNIFRSILLAGTVLVVSGVAMAQETPMDDHQRQDHPRPAAGEPADDRRNVLAQLGLSPDQVEQIRKLNAARRPLMMDAQKNLRMANRALDEAIYASQVNDADVQTRLREFQAAQAEVAKLRFTNELEVRRILTPEQLIRFRELRQRFEQRRPQFNDRRGPRGGRRFNPQRRRDRVDPPTGQDKPAPAPAPPDR